MPKKTKLMLAVTISGAFILFTLVAAVIWAAVSSGDPWERAEEDSLSFCMRPQWQKELRELGTEHPEAFCKCKSKQLIRLLKEADIRVEAVTVLTDAHTSEDKSVDDAPVSAAERRAYNKYSMRAVRNCM